jgi:hypothetical protein
MLWLALLFPPLVGLSAAHELYLRNQQELDRAVPVLYPLWLAAAALVVCTAAVRQAGASASSRMVLWAYYVCGFGLLAWSFLRALPLLDHLALWTLDTAGGAVAFTALLAASWVLAVRSGPPRKVEPLLAVLAVVLGAREALVFAGRLDRGPRPPARDVVAEARARPRADGPNIYHVLLDSFQDELFRPSAPEEHGLWSGFARFHATANGRATVQTLPTILTGRQLAGLRPDDRVREAMVGEGSLLSRLRRAGYLTVGFVPRFLYAEYPSALDVSVFHDGNARPADMLALNRSLFLRLLAYRVLPLAAVEALAERHRLGLDAEFVRSAQVRRISPFAQPVVSLLSFERFLEIEPELPERGRYTLVHVLLPHNPYRLRSDCGYDTAVPTDLGQQTDCTLRLVERLLDLLRRLDRLDPAVVMIHGDHGSGETLRAGRLVADEGAYARTLLLVKPAGAGGPLRLAGRPAGMADIAPTLLALLRLPAGGLLDGRVLEDVSGESGGPR